jgi:hypothetical protein
MLPYIYGLSPIFSSDMLSNITTAHGLASLTLDHPKINTHYDYRGNIHLYFNYKILHEIKSKSIKAKKDKQVEQANQVINKVKELILKEWEQGRSWTMWTPAGVGLKNKKQLAILNAVFLRTQ